MAMKKWPHPVPSLSMSDILTAVNDEAWQKFRTALKGRSTEDKLDLLDRYLRYDGLLENVPLGIRVIRVANYINALKRGGLLNHNLEVIR